MAHQTLMEKVPWLLREENNESDDYEPKVVSLGPYHHGKEKLNFVEDFKPQAVKMFLLEDEKNKEEDFLNEIIGDIKNARRCYDEEITSQYSDEEFARMLLRDACVILNYTGPTKDKESSNKGWIIGHLGIVVYTSIKRDMYLLENQVPFEILQKLFLKRYTGYDKAEFIDMMETYCFKMFFGDRAILEKPNATNMLGKDPLHLLEVFRRVVITGVDHEGPLAVRCCNYNNLISCIENCCGCRSKETSNTRGRYVFRSVNVLKSKGIHFTASKLNSLKGVRFSPTQFCQPAMLKLPSCNITMFTRVFFKNMIAYELSRNFPMNKNIIAYVSLMKLLVVKEEDAMELREKEIIINNLASDQEVVQLFNALNTYEAEDTAFYWDVKEGIEKHYNSKLKMWMADLKTTYFDNPWSIIAFAGAIFALFLTILQTYYSAPHGDDDKCCAKGKFHLD
ncbi:unnamed protein product [Withania somnifera]